MIQHLNPNTHFYLDSSNIVPGDDYIVKNRPWYSVAMNADGVAFTHPYVEWETRKIVISSIKAIRENGSVKGFVVVDIMLDSIPEILKNVQSNKNEKNFLVDSGGLYIYHENPDMIMTNKIYDESDELYPYISDLKNDEHNFYSVNYRGKKYYLTSYKINETGWRVINLTDVDEVKKEIYDLYSIIIGFMIASFILIIIFINLIIRIHANPYKVLSGYANSIAKGDFSINIPDKYLERTDEMGRICLSFQTIINAFRNENIVLEDKIREKNEELKIQYEYILKTEKMASLGNIVAGVAHEINTPLGIGVSIASHIDILNKKNLEKLNSATMTRDDLKEFMEDLSESIELLSNNLYRGAELVKSFKKVAVSQNNEDRELFNLKENIDSIIVSLRGEYKKGNHRIGLYCDSNLNIWSYPGLFAQLFTNLIMNSIIHGFRGKTEGFIKISCSVEESILKIIYEDNGNGITNENMEKIYEPFFTTNRSEGSSGLGMNIIFNIITQNLNGKIEGSSELNKFTKFEIEIPLSHYNYS